MDGTAIAVVASNLWGLLDVGFLVVYFLPLPGAFHPQLSDIHARVAHRRLRRELYGAFIAHEGGIRPQGNQLESPQRIAEDIRPGQFVQGLNLVALALAVD